jgi:hypothetical protein
MTDAERALLREAARRVAEAAPEVSEDRKARLRLVLRGNRKAA